MTWWQALILGVVEGVTEYLPVSSTGHLILMAWLLGLSDTPDTWHAVNSFNIVIQFGAIIAVLVLYWRRVWQIMRGILGVVSIGDGDSTGLRLAVNLFVALLPAAVIGPVLESTIEEHLFRPLPVVGALFVGAWMMLAVAYSRKLSHTEHKGSGLDHITWPIALLIGCGQCIAMWPGTSRSMMTIVAALMLGLRPRAAAEFSFLLGLVTLGGATGYRFVSDGGQMLEQIAVGPFVIGMVASAISAMIAVRWFVGMLTRYGVAPFGWYRLGLAAVITVLMATGVLTVQGIFE